jgi:hypothetical protein
MAYNPHVVALDVVSQKACCERVIFDYANIQQGAANLMIRFPQRSKQTDINAITLISHTLAPNQSYQANDQDATLSPSTFMGIQNVVYIRSF